MHDELLARKSEIVYLLSQKSHEKFFVMIDDEKITVKAYLRLDGRIKLVNVGGFSLREKDADVVNEVIKELRLRKIGRSIICCPNCVHSNIMQGKKILCWREKTSRYVLAHEYCDDFVKR